MKVKIVSLFLIAGIVICKSSFGQQKYKGTMITKMGQEQTGIIIVNLNGANNDLIEIETTEISRSKGGGKRTKQTLTTSTKLNVALINRLIINDSTYYFRDVKYDYNDKYYMNVCVRLIAGTLNSGIFQHGKSTGMDNISIKLPNDEYSKLVSADFDYYKATLAWQIFAYGNCASLRSKMEEKAAGYTWDDKNSKESRIHMWKQWIMEYNACKLEE
jgi:hypothetical protein